MGDGGERRMTTAEDRINYLNIALMIVSCIAAYLVPFPLFLLAYAVLGPAHYLTEISWIHDRRFFLAGEPSPRTRRLTIAWLALVGVALAVMGYGVVAEELLHRAVSPVWEIGLFYLVFVAAALLAFRSKPAVAVGAIVLTGVGAALFSGSPWYGLIAFLIITIVHVLLFTGAFILFGALRSRSLSGLWSLLVFTVCTLSFFLLRPDHGAVGDLVRQSYAPFELLNGQLIGLFGLGSGSALSAIYESDAGAVVMRLIAFAYTYHYLNWFTKTSVIRWHEISKMRAGVIVALWIGAVALYAENYLLGFVVLYSLSVLHVMLELPLNHRTFAGIGGELARLMNPPVRVPAHTPPRKAQRRKRATTRR